MGTSDYLVALEDPELQKKNRKQAGMPWASYRECSRASLRSIWYAFTEYRNSKSSDYDPRVGAIQVAALRATSTADRRPERLRRAMGGRVPATPGARKCSWPGW